MPFPNFQTVLLLLSCLSLALSQTINDVDFWNIERPKDMANLASLEVMCGKTHMEVQVSFDRPFNGIIFSKGAVDQYNCIYVKPQTGSIAYSFNILYDQVRTCSSTSSMTRCVHVVQQSLWPGTYCTCSSTSSMTRYVHVVSSKWETDVYCAWKGFTLWNICNSFSLNLKLRSPAVLYVKHFFRETVSLIYIFSITKYNVWHVECRPR